MFERILDWAYTVRPRFPLGWLSWPILWVENIVIWFDQSDAHSWIAHYLILVSGTLALWPIFGFWGGAVLCFVYWGREVFQIARRGPGFPFRWQDDLPDFFSALLGFLQVVGLLT